MEEQVEVKSPTTNQVKEQVGQLLEQLCKGLYEREESMALGLLAAVAGESMFLLGPPGVGKSLIARRLKFAFKEGKSFEYLMTKFSTPDEVFGPISIQKLKEQDKYERLTENYLPDAQVVFLDEIWKSSSAIQNALLTVVNEKVYRNGEQEVPVALHALITASNELPAGNDGFGPLWDRLLVRYQMEGIKDTNKFFDMITKTENLYDDPVDEELKISNVQLEQWQKEIDDILVPEELLHSLQMVRQKLDKWNAEETHVPVLVHDRRWKKIVRLMRTSAFLNGRSQVDLMDAFLMFHCLWSTPDQQLKLREIIATTIRNHGFSIALPISDFQKFLAVCKRNMQIASRLLHKNSPIHG
ncbi:MAG: AAA family ATPase [Flavobacteriales bacterium]|nr:AAA family ATPase [Flavobacteriales bacterium]